MQPWSQFWLHGSNKNMGTCSNFFLLSFLCIFAVQGFLDSLRDAPICASLVNFDSNQCYYASPFCTLAAVRVLRIRVAMVMGPTPPGTGVM